MDQASPELYETYLPLPLTHRVGCKGVHHHTQQGTVLSKLIRGFILGLNS